MIDEIGNKRAAQLIQKLYGSRTERDDDRISDFRNLEAFVKEAVIGEDVSVTTELDTTFPAFGSVTVVGRNFYFQDPEAFIFASGIASTVEIMGRTDGKVELSFGFNDLMKE